jgi:opacity protein-like surface antigen
MKKYFVFIFFAYLFGANLFAQTMKTGTTAAQVLKMNVGPRAIGRGGAFVAQYNDLFSQYWNPAGIAGIPGNEAAFVHSTLYADIRHDYAGFVTNVGGFGNIGAFVTVLSMDDMPVRTLEKPEGTGEIFNAGSLVVGVSYARNLTDNFSIGFNTKFINEYLYDMKSNGFAVDAGTLYKIPVLNELRLAASISNFGTKMKLEGRDILVMVPGGSGGSNLINAYMEVDEFSLPLMFRFGVAADIIKEDQHVLTAEIDAIHPNDHTEYLNLGLEYGWNNLIYIRSGYNSLFETDSEKGLTFGFGINYKPLDLVALKVDYAYQYFGRLKNIHYFSIGASF